MTNPLPIVTDEQVKLMKDWILDCCWQDLDEDEVEELTRDQVVRGVRRHYCGGVAQFILDCE